MTSGTSIVTIAANGRVVIPAGIREQLGLRGGDKLIARLVDGALVLESRDVAMRRARALVAKYVGADDKPVDELISERREEGQRE